MSGIFKSIGKIFSKIVNVVVKIAPYALAAAAVVFTAGAALGVLPAFGAAVGGLVSSLGLSAAVTGALTGAITSAGFGAALGFVTGGTKGMQKGALFGALSGGVLGAINPTTFGIVQDPVTGGVTTAHELATGAAAAQEIKGIAPVSNDLLNAAPLTPSSGSLTDVINAIPQINGVPDQALSQAATLGDAASAESQAAVTQATSQAAPVAQGIAPLSTQGTGVAASGGSMGTTPNLLGPNGASNLSSQLGGMPSTTGGVSSDFYSTPAMSVSQATASNPGNIISNLLGGSGGVGGNTTGLIGSVLQALGPNQYNQQASAEVKAREQLGNWAYGGSAGNANGMTPAAMPDVPMPRYYYDKATNTVIDRQQPQGS